MSQSPDDEAEQSSSEQLGSYRNAWSALSQLIGMGRSFSGHERNCFFLNNDSGRFVDASAAAGLDLIDDGRAIALADWDADGDLDIWLANRTAPRVRLLRNDSENSHHWLSVRLQGRSSNRDAIGARVEVVLDDSTRLIRTLHAGDGYLGQSSKWLHFGLGNHDSVRQLTVAWPGGARESINGVSVDRHWVIVQDDGLARPWSRPTDARRLTAVPIEMPILESASRTWILGRVPLPLAEDTDSVLAGFRGKPLLVNLWSASCTSCVRELSQWTKLESRIRAAGLEVLALPVDNDSAASDQLLARLAFPFSTRAVSSDLLHAMETIQRTFLEKQTPLPVPTSFLLDANGGVAAIYKGPVELETLIQDVELLTKSKTVQRNAAVPFAGRWASQVFPADPRPVVRTLDLAGDTAVANAYLNRYAQYASEASQAEDDFSTAAAFGLLGHRALAQGDRQTAVTAYANVRQAPGADAALHKSIAENLLRHGLGQAALEHFRIVLQSNPDDASSLYNAGLANLGLRKFGDAVKLFRAAIRIRPNDADTHFHLANALQATGQTAESLEHLRHSVELKPDSPFAANNLAWILATHPDAKVRNGDEAVRLARRICESSDFSNASTVATLAAALAESNQFDEAVKMNRLAIELATKRKNKELQAKLQQRQSLYESKHAFRDNDSR